jgi:hypothetical protein
VGLSYRTSTKSERAPSLFFSSFFLPQGNQDNDIFILGEVEGGVAAL